MQNIKIALVVLIGTLIILWSANAALASSPAKEFCDGLAGLYQSVAEARDADVDYKNAVSTMLESGLPVDMVIQIIENVYFEAAGYSPKAIRAVAYVGCLEGMGEAL